MINLLNSGKIQTEDAREYSPDSGENEQNMKILFLLQLIKIAQSHQKLLI